VGETLTLGIRKLWLDMDRCYRGKMKAVVPPELPTQQKCQSIPNIWSSTRLDLRKPRQSTSRLPRDDKESLLQ
jgi:hypothetical protein